MNSQTEKPVDLYDIQLNPRFTYVPQITGALPNGVKNVDIASFTAIYLEGLAGQGFDFDPGVDNGNQNGNKADSASAYVFYPSMLPGTLGSDPYQLNQNQFIELVK